MADQNELREKTDELKKSAQEAFRDVREEGKEVAQEAKAAITGQPLYTANTVGGAGYRADNKSSSGAAVASLVLGVLSLICVFFGYGAIIGLILGIVGVALGAKARKEAQTGIATAGFVCSLLGLIFCAVALVCAVACLGTLGILGEAVK